MVMIKIYGSTIQISFVKEGKERFFTVNLLGSYPSKILFTRFLLYKCGAPQ